MHDTIREDAEGSLVCLKGRLENDNNEVIIVAEKITIIQKLLAKKVNQFDLFLIFFL